jgi:cytochrome c oxidase assembly protein subunit 15
MKSEHRFILFLLVLSICIVMLGAFTRLTHAGLGCPDWPGCYGKLLFSSEQSLKSGQALYPDKPLDGNKALTEMTHRYVAGFLALSIFAIFVVALRKRRGQQTWPLLLPTLLLAVVVFQAMLGMWTVTLKLMPQVVMGHLLGGMSLVCGLCWLCLSLQRIDISRNDLRFGRLVGIGVLLIFIQISLGGWVSANYAGVSCIGFPFCVGNWWQQLNFKEAFNVSIHLGQDYQGGVMDTSARLTLQMTHRLMALIITSYWLMMSVWLLRGASRPVKRWVGILLFLLASQVALGISNVVFMLPLPVAVLHNGVGLLLLLSSICLFYFTREGKFSNVV